MLLPLLANQLLWISLITDSGPARAMGMDPLADDLMSRQPRHMSERVIDGRMWFDVVQTRLVIAVVTLLTMDIYLPGGLIVGSAGFTVLILTSLFNCFTARSDTASAFHKLFDNGWLWGAVALSAALQVAVVHIGALNLPFGTSPLALRQWILCLLMARGGACCGSVSCANW